MMTATPSLCSDGLNESHEVELGFNDIRSHSMEEVKSEPEPITEELELNLQSSAKLLVMYANKIR